MQQNVRNNPPADAENGARSTSVTTANTIEEKGESSALIGRIDLDP